MSSDLFAEQNDVMHAGRDSIELVSECLDILSVAQADPLTRAIIEVLAIVTVLRSILMWQAVATNAESRKDRLCIVLEILEPADEIDERCMILIAKELDLSFPLDMSVLLCELEILEERCFRGHSDQLA
jgi:hypothetical protein